MQLVGSRGQLVRDFILDASGTITTGGTPQLVLPERKSTSLLFIQNLSPTSLWIEFGGARATATLTSGVVTATTITNAGFNYTKPPIIEFLGGGNQINFIDTANTAFVGAGLWGYPAAQNSAQAHCVLTSGKVTSIVIDNGGSGYIAAPYIFIRNTLLDPNGVADPSLSSGTGILLAGSGGSFYVNGTACTTDAIAIFGATTGQAFTCKWMP